MFAILLNGILFEYLRPISPHFHDMVVSSFCYSIIFLFFHIFLSQFFNLLNCRNSPHSMQLFISKKSWFLIFITSICSMLLQCTVYIQHIPHSMHLELSAKLWRKVVIKAILFTLRTYSARSTACHMLKKSIKCHSFQLPKTDIVIIICVTTINQEWAKFLFFSSITTPPHTSSAT